MKSWGFADGYT